MAKILLVDDDAPLAEGVQSYLQSNNHTVDYVGLGSDALQLLATYQYDAIILDWGLPDTTGFEVCVAYRAKGGQTPIIFLTGNNNLDALEKALNAGADDYLSKPFNIRELYARLKTILRRSVMPYNSALAIGDVTLNLESGVVECRGQSVTLRQKELAILECLMRHKNVTYNSQQLLDAVWPADSAPSANSVRVWVNYLRQKLASINAEDLVKTMPGSGYVVQAPNS